MVRRGSGSSLALCFFRRRVAFCHQVFWSAYGTDVDSKFLIVARSGTSFFCPLVFHVSTRVLIRFWNSQRSVAPSNDAVLGDFRISGPS